jgi:hypothetical protein
VPRRYVRGKTVVVPWPWSRDWIIENMKTNIFQQLTTQHARTRCNGDLDISEISCRNMKSYATMSCPKCPLRYKLSSEPSNTCVGKLMAIATVSAGSFYEQILKLFSIMGVKVPGRKTFNRSLRGINEALDEILTEVCAENIQMEIDLAKLRKKISADGFYEIRVIVDGGYSMVNKGIGRFQIYGFELNSFFI